MERVDIVNTLMIIFITRSQSSLKYEISVYKKICLNLITRLFSRCIFYFLRRKIVKRIIFNGFITLISLLPILLPSQLSAAYTPTPTPSGSGEYLEISDLEGMNISHTRADSTYGAIFLFTDLAGTVPSWGLIYDNENTFYDMYTGWGEVRLRSIILSGHSTQAGDNILLTYDGNQKKRIYLPEMTGYKELYVGSDGSTYYDQWFCQTAQEALPPTPTPTATPTPTTTPEGYHTPSPSPTPTTTPGGYKTPPPSPSPTTTPMCYCCPMFNGYQVTLTDQDPGKNAGEYETCLCCGAERVTWWTTSTGADWVEFLPEQGLNWNNYRIFVALGDTTSLAPGQHQAEISIHDNFCLGTYYLYVNYTKPTPIEIPTPSIAPTPSPTLTPICWPCAPWLSTRQISLTDQVFAATATYHCEWCCNYTCCCDWTVSSSPGWLTIDPASGSGIDPTAYEITISLGDTSNLSYGENRSTIYFLSSGWRDYLEVVYYKYPESFSVHGGDYNGDGSSDIAIFRPSSGLWAVRGITRAYFGRNSDIPVAGDYRGSGTASIGIFRESSGLWAIRGVTRAYFGSRSDYAVPGDYDGDGSCDMGLFRQSSGLWAIRGITRVYFGETSDLPVSGDYDGDGISDLAFYRVSSGLWGIRGISRIYYGSTDDKPVPGDYNGEGYWSPGIFRSSSGLWAIRDITRIYFGNPVDQAVPADYNGNNTTEIGIFRDSSGLWAIKEVSRAYFGSSGDLPVTR